jgi:hypothetical protein
MNKEILKEEVINSLRIKEYLDNYLNDSENCLEEKTKISSFLNEYIDKPLYVVEFIREEKLYLRVENEDDEILSKELFIGTVCSDIEDFELLLNTDHSINYHVNSILEDKELSTEDKVFMIKDFIKHLNKGLYRQDATDKKGNMLQLIMNQTTNEIVDKIYY